MGTEWVCALVAIAVIAIVAGTIWLMQQQEQGEENAKREGEKRRQDERKRIAALIAELEAEPMSIDVQNKLLAYLKEIQELHRLLIAVSGSASYAWVLSEFSPYEKALGIVESNPTSTQAKRFALEVGRWHYSCQRPDGAPTVYDEQAIANDIQVRC